MIEFFDDGGETEAKNAARQDDRRQAVRMARDDRDIMVVKWLCIAMEGVKHQKNVALAITSQICFKHECCD